MSEFGDRLLELLTLKGISGNALARQLGTSSSRISQITRNQNKPDFSFLQALATLYPDVNLRYMITGQGSLVGKYVPLVDKPQQAAEAAGNYKKQEPDTLDRLASVLEKLERKL